MAIVCGTDFSTPASLSSKIAARMALRAEVPLVLVHAVNELGAESGFAAGQEGLYAPLRNRLTEEARRLRALGVSVREVFAPGRPDELLAAIAAEESARLIVVASVGARSPDAWLLGSTPERLAITSGVPILVIRGGGSWEEWLRGESALRVLAGIDAGITGEAVARFLPELRRFGACDVTAVRVVWPPGERLRLGLDPEPDGSSLPAEARRILQRELADRIGSLAGDGEVRQVIAPGSGRADQHILEIAGTIHADAVVVGTHRRTGLARLWHGSVSRAVLHHAPMSVLVVPVSSSGHEAVPIRRWTRTLATTDGSAISDRAIGEAYAGLSPGGVVHLLTVLETEPTGSAAETAARRHLATLVPADAEAQGIRTELHVVADHAVARAITATADRLGVDAICMSTHGRSGLSAALTGSIARDVLATTRRPLVLVRAQAD